MANHTVSLAILLIAGLGTPSEGTVDMTGLEEFESNFDPVMIIQAGPDLYFTLDPTHGMLQGKLGLNFHRWQGQVSAKAAALRVSATLKVDYIARYVALMLDKIPLDKISLDAPNEARAIMETGVEGCLKVSWADGLLPPPPPEGLVQHVVDNANSNVNDHHDNVTIDGETCLAEPGFQHQQRLAVSARDGHPVYIGDFAPQLIRRFDDVVHRPVRINEQEERQLEHMGLKFYSFHPQMQITETNCSTQQQAKALEALSDPRMHGFIAGLEVLFQGAARSVGSQFKHPLPATTNLTQVLLSARQGTSGQVKDGSSLASTIAVGAASGVAGAVAVAMTARFWQRAKVDGYQHLLA